MPQRPVQRNGNGPSQAGDVPNQRFVILPVVLRKKLRKPAERAEVNGRTCARDGTRIAGGGQ